MPYGEKYNHVVYFPASFNLQLIFGLSAYKYEPTVKEIIFHKQNVVALLTNIYLRLDNFDMEMENFCLAMVSRIVYCEFSENGSMLEKLINSFL